MTESSTKTARKSVSLFNDLLASPDNPHYLLQFFDHYYVALFNTCYWRSKDPDDSHTVASEAIWNAMKRLKAGLLFLPADSLRPFFAACIANAITSKIRKKRRLPVAFGDTGDDPTVFDHLTDNQLEIEKYLELQIAMQDARAALPGVLKSVEAESRFGENAWRAFYGVRREGKSGTAVDRELGQSVGLANRHMLEISKRVLQKLGLPKEGPYEANPELLNFLTVALRELVR